MRVSSSLTGSPLDWPSDNDFYQRRYYSSSYFSRKNPHLRSQIAISKSPQKLTDSSLTFPEASSESHSSGKITDNSDVHDIRNTSLESVLNTVDLVSQDCQTRKQSMRSPSAKSESNLIRNHFISLKSSEIPPQAVRYRYNSTSSRVEFLNAIYTDYKEDRDQLTRNSLKQMVELDSDVVRAKVIWLKEDSTGFSSKNELKTAHYYVYPKKRSLQDFKEQTVSMDEPWLQFSAKSDLNGLLERLDDRELRGDKCPKFSNWTIVYYDCDSFMWLFSYTSLIIARSNGVCLLKGFISVDVDINKIDINQCDSSDSYRFNGDYYDRNVFQVTIPLHGTHKCHQPSSKVSTTCSGRGRQSRFQLESAIRIYARINFLRVSLSLSADRSLARFTLAIINLLSA